MSAPHEVFQQLPWPYPDDRFPESLGAVVQKTVLRGAEPARLVLHDADHGWAIGDGLNDPNIDGACEVAHVGHVVVQNASVATLATLPPGHQARRADPGTPWVIEPLESEE